jgi:hypothetical protein
LVAFLHNSSTAFVKIPEGLNIIPKYLYSIPRSILLFLYKKTFSGQLSASFIKDHTLCFV